MHMHTYAYGCLYVYDMKVEVKLFRAQKELIGGE